MIAIANHIQIVGDFLRFIAPQIATKLAVQLGRFTCQKPNNGPRSIRLLPFVEVNFCHGTYRSLRCQVDKFEQLVFKSSRRAK
ncbi:hypothetical protein F9K97_03395 [Brucella anthropi]|uniref:hypothetical protein n=1 Tax=Brucella anthropi TaxID=529 RepID=UPI00124BFB46|nr:hypothetical protein [Brucella anthropi]KAB2788162.1 hypothetical protein F9K97_03395 [Brucella anthropi]